MSRYARQMVLPEIGAEGQARLARAHVLVVGAGGLGVPALQYLAGAGVGRITLVDGDWVAEGNLHRQPLYRMEQIGMPKARAAAAALAALNPEVAVAPVVDWLDPANARALVEAADLALDCADTFAASLTLSDACRDAGKPLIAASALALSGYAAGVCGGAPSLRAIFPDLPERGATCATAGVMGPVVATIGALQAQMALSVLLDLSPSPLGQMVRFDAARWHLGGFRFDGAPEPDDPLPFIAPAQTGPGDLLVDLRGEAPVAFAPGALRLEVEDIAAWRPPESTRRVVLACRTGLRAQTAARALRHHWPGRIALMALPETDT